MRTVGLGLIMAATWMLLSGHTEPFFLTLGLISVIIVVFVAHRMDVVDRESHPLHLMPRQATYFPWIAWEIVKANWDVTKAIFDPANKVRPTVFTVRASQKSDLGRVIYANSITLTPGTVTLSINDDLMEIHALTVGAVEGLEGGDMDRRVTALMGPDDHPSPHVEEETH